MLNNQNQLTVLHDDNSVFTDYTEQAQDYLRDSFSVTLNATEDYLYIGYYKPFNVAYVQFVTPNTIANSFTAEIYEDGAWVEIDIKDDTKGFTRNGFISWDKTDMEEEEINSEDAYWLRLRPSVTHSATSIQAINIVFSDDNSLKQEFYEVDNTNILPDGASTHINAHVAARNDIIQKLNNTGHTKYYNGNPTSPRKYSLTPFDLHEIDEIRVAATYLALAKIFFSLSDGPEDHWWAKYREYENKYQNSMSLAVISIDDNNDGELDSNENKAVSPIKRLIY